MANRHGFELDPEMMFHYSFNGIKREVASAESAVNNAIVSLSPSYSTGRVRIRVPQKIANILILNLSSEFSTSPYILARERLTTVRDQMIKTHDAPRETEKIAPTSYLIPTPSKLFDDEANENKLGIAQTQIKITANGITNVVKSIIEESHLSSRGSSPGAENR